MTRKEHLRFCSACNNKSFNPSKGITCGLTGDIADFDIDCQNFSGDRSLITTSDENFEPQSSDILANFIARITTDYGFFVTPIIAISCIIIQIFLTFSGVHPITPDVDLMIELGANFKSLTLDGEYWRLFTNFFIHFGIIHLAANMYALVFIGLQLEPFIGPKRFLISYLVSGFGASVISLWWHDLTAIAGASGAVFGMFGVYIALATTNVIGKEKRKSILITMLLFVGYNLLYGLKDGIDNAAHIGGLATGLLMGYSLYPTKANLELTIKNSALHYFAIALVVIVSVIVIKTMPNRVGEYYKTMLLFDKFEKKALIYYNLPPQAPINQQLNAVQNLGIPNMEKCLRLVKKTQSIKELPEILRTKSILLERYCNLRLNCFHYIALSLKASYLYSYDDIINAYHERIGYLIEKLNGKDIHDSLTFEPNLTQVLPIDNGKPLLIINGKPVSTNFTLDSINPANIKSLMILDANQATAIYGARGKDGAIIIELNSNN